MSGGSSFTEEVDELARTLYLPKRVAVVIITGALVLCLLVGVSACICCCRGVRRLFAAEGHSRRVHPQADDGGN